MNWLTDTTQSYRRGWVEGEVRDTVMECNE